MHPIKKISNNNWNPAKKVEYQNYFPFVKKNNFFIILENVLKE
jgi:hypothetical protein